MKYEFEQKGSFIMIHIIGNIDTTSKTQQLDREISALVEKGNHHFIFNLKRTTYLDSAGISIFIHCLCDVQQNNGSVFIIAEDNQVRRVLEMVGINRLIKTYNSEKEFFEAQKVEAS